MKYCFIVELFDKWRNCPPIPPIRRLILAARFGVLATQFGVSPCVGVQAPYGGGGGRGGWLGLHSRGLSPKHKELVFWRFLLSYMTSGPFSWWYFLLLKQRFFWYYFSYFLLCSSKSSFPGTAGIHNTSVVVCNLYCDRSSDQQETSGRNLKGFDKLIIINDIPKTQ